MKNKKNIKAFNWLNKDKKLFGFINGGDLELSLHSKLKLAQANRKRLEKQ